MISTAFHILLCIALVFTALSLFCAVTVGRRAPRQSGYFGGPSSQANRASSAPADAYYRPFARAPGFTDAQLRYIAPQIRTIDPLRRSFSHSPFTDPAGLALRTDAGSDGPFVPSGPAAARNSLRGPRT